MSGVVGSVRTRFDAAPKVSGEALYTADIRLDGALCGVLIRSPHPFARVVRVETSKAQALPGVRAIVHAGNTPAGTLEFGIRDQHLFPRPYARYAGEPVAAIAAETEVQARAAAAAVHVEYDVLEPVLDAKRALEPGAPLVHPDWQRYEKSKGRVLRGNMCGHCRIRRGDVDTALRAKGSLIHETTFRFSPGMPGYLEPRAAAAWRTAEGELTVWCGSQMPHDNRDALAQLFGLAPERVRFINQYVGGGFGGKLLLAAELYAAALALQCDRPVRVVFSRHEDGLHIYPRHGGEMTLATAAAPDGTLLAMRASILFDAGAYIGWSQGTMLNATMQASAPYRIPALDIEGTLVYTNKQVAGPVRAPGGPQVICARELHFDELAERLSLDPLEFRMRNLWQDGDVSPTGQKLDGVRVKDALRTAADAIGWGKPAPARRGRGVACSWWFSACGPSKARVEIAADGCVSVASGTVEIGSGSAAVALPMMAAEVLGVDPAKIKVVIADTASTPYDSGVGGSASTFSIGVAVTAAAQKARTQLLGRAEHRLEARADDIVLRGGRAHVRGAPDREVSFADLIRDGGPIRAEGEATLVDDPEFDEKLTENHDFASWLAPSFTASAAEVDVDPATGRVDVRRIVTAEDVGFAINPAGVIGQMEGGAVMGVGWALCEELKYDELGNVRPDFKDYLMPTAVDAPEIHSIILDSPSGAGPYGMKGAGEPSITTPPGAIACAIRAAIGVAPHETPMTPERVWRAVAGKPNVT